MIGIPQLHTCKTTNTKFKNYPNPIPHLLNPVVHLCVDPTQPNKTNFSSIEGKTFNQCVTDAGVIIIILSGGSVYELYEQSRVADHRNIRCIFTGCRGEVVYVDFIPSEELILMATFKQVLILSTKRHGTLVAQFRLVGAPSAPPLIDWMESRKLVF